MDQSQPPGSIRSRLMRRIRERRMQSLNSVETEPDWNSLARRYSMLNINNGCAGPNNELPAVNESDTESATDEQIGLPNSQDNRSDDFQQQQNVASELSADSEEELANLFNQDDIEVVGQGHDSDMNGLEPVGNGLEPVENGFEPVENGLEPVENGLEPVENGLEPVENGLEPVENGLEPVENGLEPVENGLEPVENGLEPFGDGLEPVRNGSEPVRNSIGLIRNSPEPVRNRLEPLPSALGIYWVQQIFQTEGLALFHRNRNPFDFELDNDLSLDPFTIYGDPGASRRFGYGFRSTQRDEVTNWNLYNLFPELYYGFNLQMYDPRYERQLYDGHGFDFWTNGPNFDRRDHGFDVNGRGMHDRFNLAGPALHEVQFDVDNGGENAHSLHENGQAVHENGQAVHENGQAIHENGQAIHENGQAIHENGHAVHDNSNGFDVDARGLHEDGDGFDMNRAVLDRRDRELLDVEDVMNRHNDDFDLGCMNFSSFPRICPDLNWRGHGFDAYQNLEESDSEYESADDLEWDSSDFGTPALYGNVDNAMSMQSEGYDYLQNYEIAKLDSEVCIKANREHAMSSKGAGQKESQSQSATTDLTKEDNSETEAEQTKK